MRPDKLTSTAGLTVELRYVETYNMRQEMMREDGPNTPAMTQHEDMLEAYVDGIPVGYLLTSYIPPERWDEVYPTPVHWAAHGANGNREYRDLLPQMRIPQQDWTLQTYRDALVNSYPVYSRSPQLSAKVDACDMLQAQIAWRRRVQAISSEQQSAYDAEQGARRGKPTVTYIAVYSPVDTQRYENGFVGSCDVPEGWPDMRRKGIALVMYQAAAMRLAETGMNLYPDDPIRQRPAAKRAWEKLDSLVGLDEETLTDSAGNTRVCMFLDGSKLDLPAPSISSLNRSAQPPAEPLGSPHHEF